jgi:hypothetical protein
VTKLPLPTRLVVPALRANWTAWTTSVVEAQRTASAGRFWCIALKNGRRSPKPGSAGVSAVPSSRARNPSSASPETRAWAPVSAAM